MSEEELDKMIKYSIIACEKYRDVIRAPGILYILRSNIRNREIYKIGFTRRDVRDRLTELKTGNPDLELVELFECSDIVRTEKRVHEYLSHARVYEKREFFEYKSTNELLNKVRNIVNIVKYEVKLATENTDKKRKKYIREMINSKDIGNCNREEIRSDDYILNFEDEKYLNEKYYTRLEIYKESEEETKKYMKSLINTNIIGKKKKVKECKKLLKKYVSEKLIKTGDIEDVVSWNRIWGELGRIFYNNKVILLYELSIYFHIFIFGGKITEKETKHWTGWKIV